MSQKHFRAAIFAGSLGFALVACLFTGCQAPPEPADLVLRNGKIVTVEADQPEVQAMAVRGDTIAALGTNSDIQAYVGPNTQVIDLDGSLAIPGLIEGHGHFTGIGQARLALDLTGAESWARIVDQVAQAVRQAAPGQWIVGRGWHQDKWATPPDPGFEGNPIHDSLSKISPDNPVALTHASGHASFVNAKAMELAGITGQTPSPEGGEIVKDGRGRPTGLLLEKAQGLVGRVYQADRAKRSPEEIAAEARKVALLAAEECVSKGLTSFQDAGSSFETVDLFKALASEGAMPIRLWVMLNEGNEALKSRLVEYRMVDFADHRLTVRAIKRQIDGALGSHGAWLLEPYTDLPSTSGINTTPIPDLDETARLAIESDYQFCVHAIGDRANRETLDIFERAFKAHPDKTDLRWRVEHAQHIAPADLPRFAKLGVIASMQAIHCTSDAPWVPVRLGQARAEEESYLWRSLMQSGAVVTNGTDAPVEDVSPIASFYAAVSRKLKDGSVFLPDQRMTREEALRSYTINNAFAAFEENTKGSLKAGKLADVTVLDRDIMMVAEDDLPGAKVLYTIVGGKVVYQAGK